MTESKSTGVQPYIWEVKCTECVTKRYRAHAALICHRHSSMDRAARPRYRTNSVALTNLTSVMLMLPLLFHGLCDIRARNWEYIDLVRVHGWEVTVWLPWKTRVTGCLECSIMFSLISNHRAQGLLKRHCWRYSCSSAEKTIAMQGCQSTPMARPYTMWLHTA